MTVTSRDRKTAGHLPKLLTMDDPPEHPHLRYYYEENGRLQFIRALTVRGELVIDCIQMTSKQRN